MSEGRKRGRPVGSTKNSSMSKGGLYLTMLEKQTENCPITKDSSMGWRKWGLDNLYPNKLLDLYAQSPTHHAACDFAIASIVGNGVSFEEMGLNGDEVVPNTSQTWDEVIKGLATDYILYGSYGLEVIQNRDGVTYSFYHVPLDRVRWSDYDEDGNIPSYWIAPDWTEIGQVPPTQIAALQISNDMKLEKGKPYLYVYRSYSPTMNYYQQPHYSAAIKAIQSEIEFVNYDIRHITNGFAAQGVLTLPEVETDEQRQAIITNITKMFQGSNNSNAIAITFRNSVDDKPVEYTPIAQPTNSVNLYADSNQRCINRILCSHQIPNAALIGMPDIGNSGFASEADKLEVSYQLYNKLTGNSNRMAVIRTLNQMFKLNGIDTEIIMKPLSFSDFGNDANVEERTNADAINEDSAKDQEEKKVE